MQHIPFNPLNQIRANGQINACLHYMTAIQLLRGFTMLRMGLGIVGSLVLAGCASMTGGTSQNITVITSPSEATCDFVRQGQSIGSIASTPGTLHVRRSKHDILISCTKEGYETATFYNNSGLSSAVGANIAVDLLLTAGISSIVDSANGADNEYQEVVNITMRRKADATTPVAAPAASDVATTSQTGSPETPAGGMQPIANP